MKKKNKTKRVITICITVIMMLCVFVVPSNAATYQPAENYKITEYQETHIKSETMIQTASGNIKFRTTAVLKKIYNISEINVNDIFEYEKEKSILTWRRGDTIYTSTKMESISNENREGYLFYDENTEGENILFIGNNITTGERDLQISSDNGNTYTTFSSGYIYYTTTDNIEIIVPPSFVDQTTTGMRTVLEWVAMPFNALINGGWNSLLVLFAVGVAISGVLIAVKIIRKFIWGD